MGISMKKLFLSTLLIAFAVVAQAGDQASTKSEKAGSCTEKSACPAQQTKSSCCSGATEQTKAGGCPAMKQSTESTSKQKLQSPKDSTLAKK